MRHTPTLPPIGSLVRIQAAGVETAYLALVVGHQQFPGSGQTVAQVVCHEYEGMPYSVYTSVMEVIS